ncbi:Clp protease N-terminal domain-containing protein [Streptomyces sp. NPDC056144]|uniref:Clp protease N-terminal domain-containing protein n=1 Tax=unclassified Streptomyces TaxID=2593676 RepID=UPI0035E31E79
MQPPDSRLPAPLGRSLARTESSSLLAPSLVVALSGARRRALRDGDRQVDTAHLLHALVESDPDVVAVLDGDRQLARVLGYLAQRSIGYGLRWQRTVEGPGEGAGVQAVPGWSPFAVAALEGAVLRAAGRGAEQVCALDLFALVVAGEPGCRAVEVLRRAGVDPAAVSARITGMAALPSQQV